MVRGKVTRPGHAGKEGEAGRALGRGRAPHVCAGQPLSAL